MLIYLIIILALYAKISLADTPANCTYEDAKGSWLFQVGVYNETCINFNVTERHIFQLHYPNIAIDGFGNRGLWTLIYNQGFEVTVHNRKWLIIFAYQGKDYYCNRSMNGWTHDSLIRQWKCFNATKIAPKDKLKNNIRSILPETYLDQNYIPNPKFVEEINRVQNSWTAKVYPDWSKYTLRDIRRRVGALQTKITKNLNLLSKKHLTTEMKAQINTLPSSFDWRKPPESQSPVTPVRNQHACGSCYAFASTAAVESRIRLASNFTITPILSPQDIVDCSRYSEGCNGGFPYLIAGKYGEDFGLLEEKCNVYKGVQKTCTRPKNCAPYYTTNYKYVGGYYGATNAQLMQLELIHKGPFPIGFEVKEDFMYYESGVYHYTRIKNTANRFDPFELTNHAVLVVGYGVEKHTGEPYWIMKNSWGTEWGESGFFRILRGTDECAVESDAISFDTVI